MRWLFCVAWRVKGGGLWGRADVGSELSAAGGRGSEVSEWPRSKFSASAVRQRKNFGHRNRVIGPYGSVTRSAGERDDVGIVPYGYITRGTGRNSAPFRQGGHGDGGTDCYGQCSHWPRNDIVFSWGAVCGGAHGPRPTRVFAILRADRGVRPYGSATRGAMGGRPQGSPLRKRYKECDFYRAGRCGHRPLRGEFGENKRKKQEDTGVPSCF